jgi:NAD-dependent SIR2 family protein deacetylase
MSDEKTMHAAGELLATKSNILVMMGGADPFNIDAPASSLYLDKFRSNSQEFADWASSVLERPRTPDASHRLVAELAERGLLLRVYTLNVDNVEKDAGIPRSLIRYVRGNMEEAACVGCAKPQNVIKAKQDWRAKTPSKCKTCSALVRPSMLFVGDNIPQDFAGNLSKDIEKCDALLVLGVGANNLNIFQNIINLVPNSVTRVFVNESSVDTNALKAGEVAKIEAEMKRIDQEREKLVTALATLKQDTSARDTHVLANCAKFSRVLLDALV